MAERIHVSISMSQAGSSTPTLLQVRRPRVVLGRLLFSQVTPIWHSLGEAVIQHSTSALAWKSNVLWTDHIVNINYIPKYDWHSWVRMGSPSPKIDRLGADPAGEHILQSNDSLPRVCKANLTDAHLSLHILWDCIFSP